MTTQPQDPIAQLYRESFPDFARLVRQMGGNLEQAKDCFHDALLIYLEKDRAGKMRFDVSPKAYLLGIARICWLRSANKERTQPLPERLDPADPADADDPAAEDREEEILDALLSTGKKCLELLKAFYYEHCSIQDIADRFGFNGKRSATVQKHKCLGKVRDQIKTRHSYAQ